MTSVRGMDGSQPRRGSARLIHSDVTRVILGAFYSVHSQLGYGFLEAVYKNAMALMLRRAGLVVDREVDYDVVFHGEVIGRYRADMIVERKVMVEVKAARAIDSAHRAQTLNYLRASGLHVGLLLNFGRKSRVQTNRVTDGAALVTLAVTSDGIGAAASAAASATAAATATATATATAKAKPDTEDTDYTEDTE